MGEQQSHRIERSSSRYNSPLGAPASVSESPPRVTVFEPPSSRRGDTQESRNANTMLTSRQASVEAFPDLLKLLPQPP